MDEVEKLELARVIHTIEHMLHRHCVSRFDSEMLNTSPPVPMTFQQLHMVMTVRDRGNMTIKQLASELQVKAPAVSAMVDRLVELGVLTRAENPADRREVLVGLSEQHNQLVDELERLKLQTFVDLVEKVGEKHARQWRDLGVRIQAVLEAERSGEEPGQER